MNKNLTWLHLCECMVFAAPKHLLHTACTAEPPHIVAGVRFHLSREERRFQHERFRCRAWFILAASARAWRCAQTKEGEHVGIFVEKHASPVSDSQFSFTFLFVFVLKSLLSLLFTSSYTMEAFLNFLILLFILGVSSTKDFHSRIGIF